jgi:glutamine amidotransferase
MDYGLGNLMSVVRAFESLGEPVKIIKTPDEVLEADYLVIPGVGAFKDGMEGLRSRNFVDAIIEFAKSKRPILGICLGMQLFMTESEEFGIFKGLDLIPGRVIPLRPVDEIQVEGYKVPNVGWNELLIPSTKSKTKAISDKGNNIWKKTILSNIKEGDEVYFVHSFYVKPQNLEYMLATTIYGGQEICAVIQRENIIGCQFHPEKSGEVGLRILKEFYNSVKR